MIDRREKFQRWYDLTERVHATWDDRLIPSVEEERTTLAALALTAMGVTTRRWLPDYFRKNHNDGAIRGKATDGVLQHLVETGFATPVRIKGIEDDAYVQTALLDRRIPLSRTTLLFAVRQPRLGPPARVRTVWLRTDAGSLYARAEAAIRLFSLPILYRDQLVGRLDPKAERKAGRFIVKALHLEPWFVGKDDDRFYAELAATLSDFAAFNGCEEFAIERADPEQSAERLRDALGLNVVNDEAAGDNPPLRR